MSKLKFPPYEPLDDQLRMLKGDVSAAQSLKTAVVNATAEGNLIPARVHVKKTAKAILLYVTCVALLLGAVMLLPKWLDAQPPIATEPPDTTQPPADTTPSQRDILTNPDALTPIQLEITNANWEKYKNMLSEDYTIDFVASRISQTFLHPCGNGYALFMCDFLPTGQALTRVLIGEYEFRYYDTDTLDYYEDGKFYELGDAYAANLIADDDLRGVWEAYKVRCANSYTPEADAEWEYLGYGSIVSSDPDSLSLPERYSEKELKAIYALWAVFKDKKDQITNYNVRTINDIRASEVTIHGDVVVCYDLYSKYPQGSFTETVLGYEFYYITSIRKRAFVNGAMYTLQEAYDRGLLTEEDIRIAWLSHADNGERF